MTRHQVQHYTGAFIAGSVAFLFVFIGYFNFIDGHYIKKPVTYSVDPLNLETDKEVYHRGEEVKAHIEYCKHRNIPATIQCTLVDHTVIFFPVRTSSVTKGCGTVELPVATIPKYAEPDTMFAQCLIQYQVNPFAIITVALKTQTFEVR